ncbi:MAG: sugar nucleotide-binding protein [Candidatus Heimdallarchaeota archaeon]|nr:sugar nucleotide-binding protein [Candidatus Heimdallarchaeota archaeon]
MKFVVTGATGLLGESIVKTLSTQFESSSILALGRHSLTLAHFEGYGNIIMEFDLNKGSSEYSKLDGWGSKEATWFHCAAALTGGTDDILNNVNIGETKKLIEKAEQIGVGKFVLISSIATYELKTNGNFKEVDSQKPRSKYGKSKLQQEALVKESALNWLIIRPPFIGGPNDKNFFQEIFGRIRDGRMILIGSGQFGFVDTRDLSEVIIKLSSIAGLENQSFNVQHEKIAWRDAVNFIGNSTGDDPPYARTIPVFVAKIIGFFADIKAKLQHESNERGISGYRVKTLIIDRSLNTDKLQNTLPYKFNYSFEESFSEWVAKLQLCTNVE